MIATSTQEVGARAMSWQAALAAWQDVRDQPSSSCRVLSLEDVGGVQTRREFGVVAGDQHGDRISLVVMA
jgi:hypothetical protein